MQSGRVQEPKLATAVAAAAVLPSAGVDTPSPPVSWTARRLTGAAAAAASRERGEVESPSSRMTVEVSSKGSGAGAGGGGAAAAIGENAHSYSHVNQVLLQQQHQPLNLAIHPLTHANNAFGLNQHDCKEGRSEWEIKRSEQERDRERDRETWIHDPEWIRVESWLDEHPDFCLDYFLRKATRQMVDAWLVSHSVPSGGGVASAGINAGTTNAAAGNGGGISADPEMYSPTSSSQHPSNKNSSGAATPVRKISAHEFERRGLLGPLVSTVDGTLTFIREPNEEPQSMGTTIAKPVRRNRSELESLDEKELIFELVKDICNDLDVRSLCHKILQNVSILTNADRCSLFLVQGEQGSESRCLVSKLFDVCSQSTLEEMEKKEEIRIPWGSGIVGYVAQSGEPLNIPDAYKDERFNHDVDVMTGYHTRSMLCLPIKDSNNEVIGVAQVINKLGDSDATFTAHDSQVFAGYLQFCGIGLKNAQLYERSQLEIKRNQVLLDLARMIFEEQSTIDIMVGRILTHTQSLIQCQRCQVLLVHEASKGTFSRTFDFEANEFNNADESRFPINVGITSYVATSGERVNIVDAYKDPRFDPSVDEGTGFRHKTVLCMPIKNSSGCIIGVIQLVNKFNQLPFTKNDENFVEAFSIFCGMGISNTHMYEKAIVAMAKQRVTLEVLSYHATAPIEEALKLKRAIIPSAKAYRLYDYRFNDFSLEDEETLKACLRMFLDLDLIGRFHIEYDVLCRWLLSVKKNYRNVTYHNWRHAFNVAQMMFAIVTGTQWWKILGEIEVLALIMACLCHDLDHRGTNNSFQIKASSPLAQLYTTSTMERHHFDQCLMILSSQGCQILSNVTSDEYTKIIKTLEEAILSTDLAVYFSKRGAFFQLVSTRTYDWWQDGHRELLRGMMMTACDVAAITKPWEVQWKVADLVANEFFEQGDIERRELNITPIDMMNREKKDQLPAMQVSFIDSICLPVYEAFASLTEKLTPLLDGVKGNRQHWQALADAYNQRLQQQQEQQQQHQQQRNGQISIEI